MRFLNRLTTHIFAIFWLTQALVLVLALYLLPQFDDRQLTDITNNDQTVLTQMQKNVESELNNLYKHHNQDKNKEEQFLRRALFNQQNTLDTPPLFRFILVNDDGRVFGAPMHEMRNVRNFVTLSDNINEPKRKRYERFEILGPFEIKARYNNYIAYAVRNAPNPQSAFINLIFDRPLLLLLVTMLISSPFLLWLAWSLAKPARKLKMAADSVAQGNLQTHPDLESSGPIEFRTTGRSFNQMVHSLDRMVTAQQRLISDISHELRTPLTRLQLATAILRRKQGEATELERIETEAQRLEAMINSLLQLSRSEYKSALDKEPLLANDLWCDTLEDTQFEAEHVNKTVNIISPPKAWPLFGNRAALESVLENVIRNALKYSNNYIEIRFTSDIQGITIVVDDDGPGVPEEEREQIFRPFYRTDEARDRSSGGNGLGLAIVESAVLRHEGHVEAEESHLGGLRIKLWLPLTHHS